MKSTSRALLLCFAISYIHRSIANPYYRIANGAPLVAPAYVALQQQTPQNHQNMFMPPVQHQMFQQHQQQQLQQQHQQRLYPITQQHMFVQQPSERMHLEQLLMQQQMQRELHQEILMMQEQEHRAKMWEDIMNQQTMMQNQLVQMASEYGQQNLTKLIEQLLQNLAKTIGQLLQNLATTIGQLLYNLATPIELLQNLATLIEPLIQNLVTPIEQILQNLVTPIKQLLQNLATPTEQLQQNDLTTSTDQPSSSDSTGHQLQSPVEEVASEEDNPIADKTDSALLDAGNLSAVAHSVNPQVDTQGTALKPSMSENLPRHELSAADIAQHLGKEGLEKYQDYVDMREFQPDFLADAFNQKENRLFHILYEKYPNPADLTGEI